MRDIARRSFEIAIWATLMLVVAALLIAGALQRAPPDPTRIPLLEFELDMFRTIFAGFVVSMLGILIPAVASEARQLYEQRKESRAAYSEAKTGIDYLKLRLAALNFPAAGKLLQTAHYYKHQAELFDDFPEWLERRFGKGTTPDEWDTAAYDRLFKARQVLEKHASGWDALKPGERIALLDDALPTRPLIEPKTDMPANQA